MGYRGLVTPNFKQHFWPKKPRPRGVLKQIRYFRAFSHISLIADLRNLLFVNFPSQVYQSFDQGAK